MSSILKVDQLQDSGGNNLVTSNGSGVITAAGFGKVGQVVTNTSTTLTSTTSASYVDTNISASITPSSTSSKIMIIVSGSLFNGTANTSAKATIFRGNASSGTNLGDSTWGMINAYDQGNPCVSNGGMNFLDSPSTTSSQLYTVAIAHETGGNTAIYIPNGQKGSITLMEILP